MSDLLAARSQMAVSLAFHIVLIALIVGGLVLFPSLYYLFRVFKGRGTAA